MASLLTLADADFNDPEQVEELAHWRAKWSPPRRRRPTGALRALPGRGFFVGLLLGAVLGGAVPHRAEASGLGVTAYCLQGVMADGRSVHRGAAASNYYPFGELLYIDGFGEVVVEDRSAPGATFVDLWVPSCRRAWQWGRRDVRVYDEGNIYAED